MEKIANRLISNENECYLPPYTILLLLLILLLLPFDSTEQLVDKFLLLKKKKFGFCTLTLCSAPFNSQRTRLISHYTEPDTVNQLGGPRGHLSVSTSATCSSLCDGTVLLQF